MISLMLSLPDKRTINLEAVLFFFLLIGYAIWLSKDQPLSQRRTIWLQLLNTKTRSCPESLTVGYQKATIQTVGHPEELTLMASGGGGPWP